MKKIESLIILLVIASSLIGCNTKKNDEVDNSQDSIVSNEPDNSDQSNDENVPEIAISIDSIELSPDDYGIKINTNITDFDENNQYGICYINETVDKIELDNENVSKIEINSDNNINGIYTVSIKYIHFYTSQISLNAYCIINNVTYYTDINNTSMLYLAKDTSSEYANKIVNDCIEEKETMNIVTITINSYDYTFENDSDYYNVSYSHDQNYEENTVLITMNEGYNIGSNVTLHEIDNSKTKASNRFISDKSGTINGKKYNININDNVLTYTFEDRNWSPFY